MGIALVALAVSIGAVLYSDNGIDAHVGKSSDLIKLDYNWNVDLPVNRYKCQQPHDNLYGVYDNEEESYLDNIWTETEDECTQSLVTHNLITPTPTPQNTRDGLSGGPLSTHREHADRGVNPCLAHATGERDRIDNWNVTRDKCVPTPTPVPAGNRQNVTGATQWVFIA